MRNEELGSVPNCSVGACSPWTEGAVPRSHSELERPPQDRAFRGSGKGRLARISIKLSLIYKILAKSVFPARGDLIAVRLSTEKLHRPSRVPTTASQRV